MSVAEPIHLNGPDERWIPKDKSKKATSSGLPVTFETASELTRDAKVPRILEHIEQWQVALEQELKEKGPHNAIALASLALFHQHVLICYAQAEAALQSSPRVEWDEREEVYRLKEATP